MKHMKAPNLTLKTTKQERSFDIKPSNQILGLLLTTMPLLSYCLWICFPNAFSDIHAHKLEPPPYSNSGHPGAGNSQMPPLLWTTLYPSGQLRYLFWFLWIIIPHSQHKSHHPSDHPQMALSLLTLIILRHWSYLLHSISIPNPYEQGLNRLEFKVLLLVTV